MDTVDSFFQTIQTKNGIIALAIIFAALLIFLIVVTIFGLEISFKPFYIKRVPRRQAEPSASSQPEPVDVELLISIIRDAYSLLELHSKTIKHKYEERYENSSKKCIAALMNTIMLEYIDLIKEKGRRSPPEIDDQRDIVELYLEKDINEVIISALKNVRSHGTDVDGAAATDNMIETLIEEISIDLKTRLLKYRLVGKDQTQELRSVLDDSQKIMAGALHDAFKNYMACAQEEQKEIDSLLETHNKDLREKIQKICDIDTAMNSNSEGEGHA